MGRMKTSDEWRSISRRIHDAIELFKSHTFGSEVSIFIGNDPDTLYRLKCAAEYLLPPDDSELLGYFGGYPIKRDSNLAGGIIEVRDENSISTLSAE